MEEIINQLATLHQLCVICIVGMLISGAVTFLMFQKMKIREVLQFFKRHGRNKHLLLVLCVCGGMMFGLCADASMNESEGESSILNVFEITSESEDTEDVIPEDEKVVIDHVAPRLEALYELENPGTSGEWCERGTWEITEPYLDFTKSKIMVSMMDRNGKLLAEPVNVLSDSYYAEMEFKEDAHYYIEAFLVDLSGNETTHEKTFYIDHDPPQITEVKCVTESGEVAKYLSNQQSFQYFTKEKSYVHITAKDLVTGTAQIGYQYKDAQTGEITEGIVEAAEEQQDKNLSYIVVELPFPFKGSIEVYAADYAGNVSEPSKEHGVIVESEELHGIVSGGEIEVITAFSKTPGYYANDVEVKFTAKDAYSGLSKMVCTAGGDWKEENDFDKEIELVTDEVVINHTIRAEENQNNHVLLGLEFTDQAGHRTILSEEELPKIHIDTIAPNVWVEYDNHEVKNERYYKEPRTATVYVEERNFDPSDVHFELSGPSVSISKWSHHAGNGCEGSHEAENTKHTDTCVWSCQVGFQEDGEYRFGFSCVDLAGNESGYGRVDEFIIDQTLPKIQVSYDNNHVRNGFYYQAPRTATIIIEERNFEPSEVEITLTAKDLGVPIRTPGVSVWSSSGDKHQAVIAYDYDGAFSFDVAYEDMAGNAAEDYPEDSFVVDMTLPEIVISEVKDKSANQGMASPMIQVSDTNYDSTQTGIALNGWNHGQVEVKTVKAVTYTGEMYRVQDFPYERSADDMYRLVVTAMDLAGNQSEEQITFSVNRFGSVYTLDRDTKKLIQNYYTSQEIPVVVTETNVDTLTYLKIVRNLNGKLKVLEEGNDYIVRKSGDDSSWKQYEYIIYAENFAQDGHYNISFYSEDRAQNTSSNQLKGAGISFAVDHTVPSIVISGVEQEGRYRETAKTITLDVQDNVNLSGVTVFYNEKQFKYDAAAVRKSNGKIQIMAESHNDWQTLKVLAEDMAGNEAESEEIVFLITPSWWVQLYRNQKLFYGSVIAAMTLAGMGGCAVIVWRKRKVDV